MKQLKLKVLYAVAGGMTMDLSVAANGYQQSTSPLPPHGSPPAPPHTAPGAHQPGAAPQQNRQNKPSLSVVIPGSQRHQQMAAAAAHQQHDVSEDDDDGIDRGDTRGGSKGTTVRLKITTAHIIVGVERFSSVCRRGRVTQKAWGGNKILSYMKEYGEKANDSQ